MTTPVLMVPGMLCSAELFAPQAAALWPRRPVMITSTLEGATIPEIAKSVLANAPSRFALVGLSMGGYIAFEIMRQAPERVERLALLGTSARADTPEQATQRAALVAQASAGEFETWASDVLTSLLHPAHQEHLRATNYRMAHAIGLEGFKRQAAAVTGRPSSLSGLAVIRIPTLVLVGDADTLTPRSHSEEIARSIPNARLVIVPECGHGSTLEQPEAVAQALLDWLDW